MATKNVTFIFFLNIYGLWQMPIGYEHNNYSEAMCNVQSAKLHIHCTHA